MSQIKTGSFEQLRTGFTGKTKGTLVELYGKLKEMSQNQQGVIVIMAEDGVRMDLESAAFFDTASAVLKPGSLDPLEPLLREILSTSYMLDIEGHADDRPLYKKVGEEIETNWSLSGRRASSVVHHLLNVGFKTTRLRVVGYANTKPKKLVGRKTGKALKQARAQNRRVSILVK